MLVAVSVVGGILLSCVLAAGGWVLSVASDAPNVNKMKPIEKGQNSVIIAGDGSKLGLIDSDEIRTPISLKDMPKNIQDATIAIEDERFYEHNGIDYTGGLRAMVKNLEEGEVTEGASTLTMQLMRNLYIINPNRSFQRKIMEEAFETCLELGKPEVSHERLVSEAADLVFHLTVGLVSADASFDEVLAELDRRRS